MRLPLNFSACRKTDRILLMLIIAGFAVGTSTHVLELAVGGWLPYTSVPFWKNLYWSMLTFLDPLVILLIFIRLKPALGLANAVIISDVLINTEFFTNFGYYRILMQAGFCVYVIAATIVIVVRAFNTDFSK